MENNMSRRVQLLARINASNGKFPYGRKIEKLMDALLKL
jgi:hypothetical protein